MTFEAIVDDYISERRPHARAELAEFRKLRALQAAIHHATLCHWLPSEKRHPHQYRIPAAALLTAERKLQQARSGLGRAKTFEALHDEVERQIRGIHKIGPLAVYDIAHRIGAHLGLSPRLVYLHRGTLAGVRSLGFTAKALDPRSLPPAFSHLKPYEIEDCLCIYKNAFHSKSRSVFSRRRTDCGLRSSPRSRC